MSTVLYEHYIDTYEQWCKCAYCTVQILRHHAVAHRGILRSDTTVRRSTVATLQTPDGAWLRCQTKKHKKDCIHVSQLEFKQ